jgi:thiamine biosynthesis lipoprotein ApbE
VGSNPTSTANELARADGRVSAVLRTRAPRTASIVAGSVVSQCQPQQSGLIALTRRDLHAQVARESGMAVTDWPVWGTSAQLVVTDPGCLDVARSVVEGVIADVDLAASRFRTDSELSRLNDSGGEWQDVSPLLMRALRVAIDAAEWTGGLVDPTVGAALVDLGYDRTFSLVPADGDVVPVRVRTAPGWHRVQLDEDASRVRVTPGTLVDLGATAKGLAADLAADAAANDAGCGVLVSLGGDISVAGPPPDDGWVIGVADLTDLSLPADGADEQVVVIRSGGLATSSTSARRWRRGGFELHHLIDPRSGMPATGPWRSVSVTASTCLLANTASTAAVIAGSAAPEWVRIRGFHARLVRTDGSVLYVGAWPRAARPDEET